MTASQDFVAAILPLFVQPTPLVAVAVSSTAWIVVSAIVGWRASSWTAERLDRPGPVTRLRHWEQDGRFWRRVRVEHWKDRVPEAGALFPGGRSKRQLTGRSDADLRAFQRETVRAERVHWLILASSPIHALWCDPTLFASMVVFGLAFDLPFIVIQRFNRGRIHRILSRRAERATRM